MFVVLGVLVGMTTGQVFAKDLALEQAMVDLEKTYIPPLFQTNMEMPATPKSMGIFTKQWNQFKATYADYRSDYMSWGAYFEDMQDAIDRANAIVMTGSNFKQAHEELEAVRSTMLKLRSENGFPKFITDKMTAFHDPMEHVVLTILGNHNNLTDELLAAVDVTFGEALKAWDNVEKCPVDAGMWGFTPEQMTQYFMMLQQEKAALDAYAQILASRNLDMIVAKAKSIKGPFVTAYTFFGDFSPFQPAAQ